MCRICVAHCGLVVTAQDGRVVDVKGDPDHPISRGYACSKGQALKFSQNDPNRLDYASIGRGVDRRQVALHAFVDDLGACLTAIRDEHGPDAIAFYTGGQATTDSTGGSMMAAWTAALGTRNVYTTHTLDTIAREVAYRLMQGRPPLYPTFDVKNCKMLVLMATNPPLSHGHTLAFPNAGKHIREISKRGAVWVFDPRRSESARNASRHVALRPGSDHAVLAYSIRELLRDGADKEFIARWTERVDKLRQAVEPYTLDVAADIADVDPALLQEFVEAIRRAGSIVVLPGTGLGFSPNPAVTEWLVMALNAITGSIEAPGGLWFNPGFWNPSAGHPDTTVLRTDAVPSGPDLDFRPTRGAGPAAGAFEPAPGPPSRPDLNTWAATGERPAAALADEIEAGNVKALIVLGGNPLSMSPNFEKVRRAYSKLEILAVADVIDGDMTAVATHVFPTAAQLERADCAIVDPLLFDVFGQYTDAVVAPTADRRPLWWFAVETARRMGIQLLPDEIDSDPDAKAILKLMFPNPRIPFDEMVASPGGQMVEVDRRPWYTENELPSQRWNLAPQLLVDTMRDMVALPDGLVLVSRRQRYHMNSVHRDLDQGASRVNEAALFLSPSDADERGLADGDLVTVTSNAGSLTLPVRVDDTMRHGTASIPHGYRSVNVNQLTDDSALLDFTGMPRFSTIPITVERASKADSAHMSV
jgi:anaerobic selenocysteine-containing dehydrogenase